MPWRFWLFPDFRASPLGVKLILFLYGCVLKIQKRATKLLIEWRRLTGSQPNAPVIVRRTLIWLPKSQQPQLPYQSHNELLSVDHREVFGFWGGYRGNDSVWRDTFYHLPLGEDSAYARLSFWLDKRRKLQGDFLWWGSFIPYNIGHFIVDFLGQACFYSARPNARTLDFLFGFRLTSRQRELLALLPHARFHDSKASGHWKIDGSLWVLPPKTQLDMMRNLSSLSSQLRGSIGVMNQTPRTNVYIRRGGSYHSPRLVDEHKLERNLYHTLGVKVVDSMDMSLTHLGVQVARASALIGAFGAALTTMIFMNPGGWVVEVSNGHSDYFADMAKGLDLRYLCISESDLLHFLKKPSGSMGLLAGKRRALRSAFGL
jgi:hypothetical protein